MQTWTMKFNALILEALKLDKKHSQVPQNKIDQILLKLDNLLEFNINPKWK